MQGKIALEEHFILPSFGAYGADASALDGATKPTSRSGWARRRCGLRTWPVATSFDP
jgi:hypothetical protein